MRKSQSPVRAVKKVIAKAKARATRKKTQSAKEARALTSRVRQAMPKKKTGAGKRKSAALPKAAAKPKARRPAKKRVTIFSALKEGLEILGESILPPSRPTRSRR